jgi:hypothetical protein
MPQKIGNLLADSLQAIIGNAERLTKDLRADHFARLAAPGGYVVQSNHPAFVMGHLALYPPRIVEYLGGDTSSVKVPAGFQQAFSKDASCRDDADGRVYPEMNQILDAFFNGYRAVLKLLRETPDEAFEHPNPLGGTFAERFPSLGSMINFYVGGHAMLHLGQLSAWRRMMGLGPA